MSLRYRFVFVLSIIGFGSAWACSGGVGEGGAGEGGSGSSSTTGSDANGGLDAGGGLDLGADTDGAATPPGELTADSACAAIQLEPEPIQKQETIEREVTCTAEAPAPLSIYLMLDNSGSMDDNHKWEDAVDAISEFVQADPAPDSAWVCVDEDGNEVTVQDLPNPGAGRLSAAIQYFHPQDAGRDSDECNGSGHSTPAVDMGPLPDNADNIIDSLNDTRPRGDTPTVGALTGGIEYCADLQQVASNPQCVVVLVTDGQPNGCGLDSGDDNSVDPDSAGVLTPIAEDGFNDGVLTFTVGMEGISDDGFDLLDAIAIAGGSDCTPNTPGDEACNVSTGGAEAFLDALNTIRDTVQVTETSSETITTTVTETSTQACEWLIPDPPPGETFDKALVNVTISGGNTGSETLGNVASAADCSSDGGWYYDNPAAPTRILVCPSTCSLIESSQDSRVQVLLGCATKAVDNIR